MKKFYVYFIMLTLVLAWIGTGPEFSAAATYEMVPRISTEALKNQLNEPALVILDVRIPKHIEASTYKILGAVLVNPAGVDTWSQFFDKDATFVLY
jgi:hypothetical protein